MSVSLVFRPDPVPGPVTYLAPVPRPQLYRARGIVIGDITGGTVTMQLSWDFLREGQIAVCRQSFIIRNSSTPVSVTIQASGIMVSGVTDNMVLYRYGADSANASTQGSQAQVPIPIVVRHGDQPATVPWVAVVFSDNVSGVLYSWLSWWVVADLLLSTPDDVLRLLSLPQEVHP